MGCCLSTMSTLAGHLPLDNTAPWMQELVAFWQQEYNWDERQAALNKRFKQFRMPVNGIDMHFAHHRSEDPHAVPLLLIHGWPGSFVEFMDILPLLNSPGEHCMLASVMLRLRAASGSSHGKMRQSRRPAGWYALRAAAFHLYGLIIEAPLDLSAALPASAQAPAQCLQVPASRPSMW